MRRAFCLRVLGWLRLCHTKETGLPTRIRNVFRAAPWAGWLALGAIFFAMALVGAMFWDTWISDSRFYLAWSYRYLGYSEADAARMTYEYMSTVYNLDQCDFCWPPDYQRSFFHGENGAVTAPRLIYPLLSAPFVALLGPGGMLVVPALAQAIGAVTLAYLASRLWGRWWGVAAALILLVSAISMRYTVMVMTDSLALMLNVLGLLFLPLLRERRRGDVLWFLVILAVNLFTRQFAVTVAAGAALAWLVVAIRDRKARNAWLPFAIGSVLLTPAIVFLQNFVAGRFFGGGELSLTERYNQLALERFGVDGIASIPTVLGYQAKSDFTYLRDFDIPLLVLLAAAVVAMLWRFRSELSALLAGTALVTVAMSVIIVDQIYFRYFVPLVPLMILCVLALLKDLFFSGTQPGRSAENQPAQARNPVRPQLVWIVLGAVYLLAAYLTALEHTAFGQPLLLTVPLTGIAIGVLFTVVAKRAGQTAGALAAVAFTLSHSWLSASLDTVADSVALLAVVVALAFLPGSGFAFTGRTRHGALAFCVLIASAISLRSLALPAALILAWVFVTVRSRSARNDWAIPALIAIPGALLNLAVSRAELATGNLADLRRSVWLMGKEAITDRVLIAVAIIAVLCLLARLNSELTWLALGAAGAGVAVLLASGSPPYLAATQLSAPLILLATATQLAAYIRGDLAGARSVAGQPASQPATHPAAPVSQPAG
jgi:hypothetical protein